MRRKAANSSLAVLSQCSLSAASRALTKSGRWASVEAEDRFRLARETRQTRCAADGGTTRKTSDTHSSKASHILRLARCPVKEVLAR